MCSSDLVNVFRVNMSHGTQAEHAAVIATIREQAAALQLDVDIVLDEDSVAIEAWKRVGIPPDRIVRLAAGLDGDHRDRQDHPDRLDRLDHRDHPVRPARLAPFHHGPLRRLAPRDRHAEDHLAQPVRPGPESAPRTERPTRCNGSARCKPGLTGRCSY